jgi:hypothetical protein
MNTAVELPTSDRHPDGVALESGLALPRAVERAPAAGVVSLKEPVGDAAIQKAVDAFFAVFTNHDGEALDALLSRSARLLDAHGGSTYGTLREELRGRIRNFDAAGITSVRVEGVERFDYRDLGGDAGVRDRPKEMRPSDVLVRVHVSLPRSSGMKLFGSVVVLLWRWEEDGEAGKAVPRVAGYDEEEEAARSTR